MLTPMSQQPEKTLAERAITAIALAFAFLTIVPTRPLTLKASDDDVQAARFAFPLVGLALGLVMALVSGMLHRAGIAPGVAAFLLVAALAALTGVLHLDGLADTADGLFVGGDSARRLDVMRDPRIGSFGVAALVLCLLGKHTALASLPAAARGTALFGAIAVSRSLILVAAGRARYARAEGTGRLLVDATTPQEALAAGALALLLASLTGYVAGLVAGLVALGGTLALTAFAKGRVGGITGDILGAVVELGELGYLIVLGCVW